MKRRIGTALSVVSLLAMGTAAAAVNVRLLNGSGVGASLTSFEVRASGDAQTPLTDNAAIGSARPLTVDEPAADATASPSVDVTAPTSAPGPIGPLAEPGLPGFEDGRHGMEPGDDRADRPALTQAQLTLLRVSAMLRMRPEVVAAVARGEITDVEMVAGVQRAADAVGTTLAQLAVVEVPERHHERGHGGDGARVRGGGDSATGLLAPVTTTTNDD